MARWVKGQSGNKKGRPKGSLTINHRPYKKDVKLTTDYLYLFRQEGYFKIGISKTPGRRLAVLQTSTPFEVEIVLVVPIISGAVILEKYLQDYFKEKHERGEWYRLSIEDCEFIQSYSVEFQAKESSQFTLFELEKHTGSYHG